MSTLELDIIRREHASQNNTDIEKGEVVRPGASQSPYSISLILQTICALAGQSFDLHILTRYILTRLADDALSTSNPDPEYKDVPPLRGLGFLDRFLVLWIVLAMAIGIILGDFVPSTGPALQKGQFVGVSVPIGMVILHSSCCPLQVLC
jgi:hypothetical protein